MKETISRRLQPAPTSSQGFSMIEMMIVIGVIGVLVGVGTMGYISQINRTRVESAAQVIQANMQRARQMAIAMRQTRRVAIDAGQLEGQSSEQLTGPRTKRASIWIEGKRVEAFNFDVTVPNLNKTANLSKKTLNKYALTDPDSIPDFVMIADIDGQIPGLNENPNIFYIEFNSHGAIRKVYFDGRESSTTYNQIAPVIHITRDSEQYTVGNQHYGYKEVIDHTGDKTMQFSAANSEDFRQRYKVFTVEVVRLTGRTRMYDYGLFNPWPLDEPSSK